MPAEAIPRFQLYGERERASATDFLHIETIWSRSHRLDWTIRPHRHDDLVQLLFVAAGGGTLTLDGHEMPIVPPWLVALPPAVVHGFAFLPDTAGYVLTVSEDFLYAACAPNAALATSVAQPLILNLPDGVFSDEIAVMFRRIEAEFLGARLRRLDALGAFLRLLVIAIDRACSAAEVGELPHEAAAASYARFRVLLEARWREWSGLEDYARALVTTPARLNAACRRTCGRTAGQLVRDRVVVEARRQLAYTTMTVSEIAYDLGFADPAYFSRWFRTRTGQTPRAYRGGAGARR